MRERAIRLQARELREPLPDEVITAHESGALHELRQLVFELELQGQLVAWLEWTRQRDAQIGFVVRVVRAVTIACGPQVLTIATPNGEPLHIDVAVRFRL